MVLSKERCDLTQVFTGALVVKLARNQNAVELTTPTIVGLLSLLHPTFYLLSGLLILLLLPLSLALVQALICPTQMDSNFSSRFISP